MSDIINEISVSIEEVLKSDPNIRHLLDVACPLYIKDKLKIKAVLIICRSYFIRKTIVDLLKLKSEGVSPTASENLNPVFEIR